MSACHTILKLASVVELTKLSPASIYRFIRKGYFPQPFKLGPRASGWYEAEITAWINGRRDGGRVERHLTKHDYHPQRFADPRSLFEFSLYQHIDGNNIAHLTLAIGTLTSVAKKYKRLISLHERNVATGGSLPELTPYSSEREEAHAAIMERADIAWLTYQPDAAQAEITFTDIWQSILSASEDWVNPNDIDMLKTSHDHIWDMIATAAHRIEVLADRETDKESSH